MSFKLPARISNLMTAVVGFAVAVEFAFAYALVGAEGDLQPLIIDFMIRFAVAFLFALVAIAIFRPQVLLRELKASVEDIDKKIESMPMYTYPKLSEPAKQIFLRTYGDVDHPVSTIIDDLETSRFTKSGLEGAAQELLSCGWLERKGYALFRTDEGQKGYNAIDDFVHGRWR